MIGIESSTMQRAARVKERRLVRHVGMIGPNKGRDAMVGDDQGPGCRRAGRRKIFAEGGITGISAGMFVDSGRRSNCRRTETRW